MYRLVVNAAEIIELSYEPSVTPMPSKGLSVRRSFAWNATHHPISLRRGQTTALRDRCRKRGPVSKPMALPAGQFSPPEVERLQVSVVREGTTGVGRH